MTLGSSLVSPGWIDGVLARGLRDCPEEPALVSADAALTWRDLDELSSRLAGQYLRLGLAPGDRVASLMPNRPELVIHYLACLKSSLVATPLNYRYMPPEIDHALSVSKASLLVHHGERDGDVAASRFACQLPKGVIRFEATSGGGLLFEELLARSPANVSLPALDPEALAFVYFTSGSTGKPKGVMHSRRTYNAMMAILVQAMELTSGDTILPGLSFSHIAGSLASLTVLASGARLVVPRSTDGPTILPLLREHRPTVLWMLPAALIALVRDHEARHDDFRSIRLCTSGGDKVGLELEREFTALSGLAVDEQYGMTEIGLAAINPPSGENRAGSIGRLCAGFEMELRDEAGRPVPVGQQGRLWVRSPSITVGYFDNPQATRETIVDGWLDTGDVMRVDDEGYLWFCGRKKQIIVHDGSNICPQEVEEAIEEHPAIAEAGVIGIHDLVHGENVRAYVTLKDSAERPTAAELIAFARQRVGYKAPEEIVFLDEMPLTAAGKVDRVRLKATAAEITA